MLDKALDLGVRLVLRNGYRVLSAYWYVRRPRTRGVNVALWHSGTLLVLQNSYRPGYSLPGGGLAPDESRVDAAARELREEVGVLCPPHTLWPVLTARSDHEHKDDTVDIFEAVVERRPHVTIDHREVSWADFLGFEQVQHIATCPQLRAYLRLLEREGRRGPRRPCEATRGPVA